MTFWRTFRSQYLEESDDAKATASVAPSVRAAIQELDDTLRPKNFYNVDFQGVGDIHLSVYFKHIFLPPRFLFQVVLLPARNHFNITVHGGVTPQSLHLENLRNAAEGANLDFKAHLLDAWPLEPDGLAHLNDYEWLVRRLEWLFRIEDGECRIGPFMQAKYADKMEKLGQVSGEGVWFGKEEPALFALDAAIAHPQAKDYPRDIEFVRYAGRGDLYYVFFRTMFGDPNLMFRVFLGYEGAKRENKPFRVNVYNVPPDVTATAYFANDAGASIFSIFKRKTTPLHAFETPAFAELSRGFVMPTPAMADQTNILSSSSCTLV